MEEMRTQTIGGRTFEIVDAKARADIEQLQADVEALQNANPADGVQIVKLWENAKPSSVFAAQTINIDLTGYDMFAIKHYWSAGVHAARVQFGFPGEVTGLDALAVTGAQRIRRVNVSTTAFVFETGYHNSTENNDAIIPAEIYGIKGVTL